MQVNVGAGTNLSEFSRTEIADGFGATCVVRAGDCGVSLDLDLIVGAIALAVDAHGLGVVQQAVEQGGGEVAVVVEDAGPLLVDAVSGDQGAPCGCGRRRPASMRC